VKTREQVIEEIRVSPEIQAQIDAAEQEVMGKTTLADLIRGGSKHTVQVQNWGAGENACALSAGAYAAAALGIIDTK
jgi:hypothetical protein